jgi:hypothetical protein
MRQSGGLRRMRTSHRLRRRLHGFQGDATGKFGVFCLRDAGAGNAHLLRDLGTRHAEGATNRAQPPLRWSFQAQI